MCSTTRSVGIMFIGLIVCTAWPGLETHAAESAGEQAAPLYFHLSGDTRPFIDDSSFAHDVIVDGIQLAQGHEGRAIDLAAGGYVMAPLLNNSQPLLRMTVECWIFWNGEGESKQKIVGRSGMYGLSVSAEGMLNWRVAVGDESTKTISAPIEPGRWMHVAGMYDGHKLGLFVDRQRVAEAPHIGVMRYVDPIRAPLHIGSSARTPRRPMYLQPQMKAFMADPPHRFNGRIDEVRIWGTTDPPWADQSDSVVPDGATASLTISSDSDGQAEDKQDRPREMMIGRVQEGPQIDGQLDDAVWQQARVHEFVDARQGLQPSTRTYLQATYDERMLYLAFRGIEQGQETQIDGTEQHDDKSLFNADAVEIFLQPQGPGHPYYQIAVNPAGGVYDVRTEPHGARQPWDCQGLRVAGRVVPDVFVIEVGIPFESLGMSPPSEGESWRVNFCRTEQPARELTAWSPPGGTGSYHQTERFGTLHFGHGWEGGSDPQQEQKRSAPRELWGRVVKVDGTPVQGLLVRSAQLGVRTDPFGRFRLRGLTAERSPIKFVSPRYHPVAGEVVLDAPVERLAPITVSRIDSYRPAFEMQPAGQPVTWLSSTLSDPPDMEAPSPPPSAERLPLIASPGEITGRAVAFVAHEDLPVPDVQLADLRASDGELFAGRVSVRWTGRSLRGVKLRSPPEESVSIWRYLWESAPEKVAAGQVRQLVLTFHLPENTKPGSYRGELRLQSEGDEIASLPVRLRVADIALRQPTKRLGAYYVMRDASEAQIDAEMEDIRAHGGSTLLVTDARLHITSEGPVVSSVERMVNKLHEHNFDPPYLVGTAPHRAAIVSDLPFDYTEEVARQWENSDAFEEAYRHGLEALDKLERSMGLGEFMYHWMDEITNGQRIHPWLVVGELTKRIADNDVYVTLHNRVPREVEQVSPYLDIRCYHGYVMDQWLADGNTFEDLQRKLDEAGDTAWVYYNARSVEITPKWYRVINGVWLWQSPFEVHLPWIYYGGRRRAVDPHDGTVQGETGVDTSLVAPHPDRPGVVATLHWECFREGYNDLRYVVTLEHALARAASHTPAAEAVEQARRLLATLRHGGTPAGAIVARMTGDDLIERRRQVIVAIERLAELSNH